MLSTKSLLSGSKRSLRSSRRSYSEAKVPVYHIPGYTLPDVFTEDVILKVERKLRSQPRTVLSRPSQAYADNVDPSKPVRRAAVLVPLINWSPKSTSTPFTSGRERASILYNLRSSTLRNHGGQVSFPGGVMDPEDEGDFIKTALRETTEELGIDRSLVRPLGLFHDVTSLNGILVTPVIAHIPDWSSVSQQVKLSQDEVEEAFEVPITSLIDPSVYSIDQLKRGRLPRFKVDPNRPEKDIWGLTAYITDWLLRSTFHQL